MSRPSAIRHLLIGVAVATCLAAPAVAGDPPQRWLPSAEARTAINDEKRRDPSVPGQAAALIRLAWGDDPISTDEIRAAARQELEGFGKHALRPIRDAFRSIPPRFQADAVATFIEARVKVRSELPTDFLAGMDEFIWFGSREARRVAIDEMARFSYPPVVLTMIDAVHDDPALLRPTLRTLALIGDDRAHVFLGRALRDPDPSISGLAARTMGRIGGRAKTTLRELVATASGAPAALRRAAVDGLLARPTIDDLTVLHEFIGDHLEVDDDELVDRARLAAAELELRLEQASPEEL